MAISPIGNTPPPQGPQVQPDSNTGSGGWVAGHLIGDAKNQTHGIVNGNHAIGAEKQWLALLNELQTLLNDLMQGKDPGTVLKKIVGILKELHTLGTKSAGAWGKGYTPPGVGKNIAAAIHGYYTKLITVLQGIPAIGSFLAGVLKNPNLATKAGIAAAVTQFNSQAGAPGTTQRFDFDNRFGNAIQGVQNQIGNVSTTTQLMIDQITRLENNATNLLSGAGKAVQKFFQTLMTMIQGIKSS